MDRHITVHDKKKEQALVKYIDDVLLSKFGKYNFINTAEVDVKMLKDDTVRITMKMVPKNGEAFFVSHEDNSEKIALRESLKKMKSQIEKYKTKHFQSERRVDKGKWRTDN